MEPNKPEIKQYADGWITERAGTDVPKFLKFAFIAIAGGCLGYLLLFMNGEVDHPDRGQLVRTFNAATETSGTLMYAVAAMIVVFGVIVVAFSFSKPHD
jgi:hypothetical protein